MPSFAAHHAYIVKENVPITEVPAREYVPSLEALLPAARLNQALVVWAALDCRKSLRIGK